MSLQGIGLVTVKGEPLTPYPSAWARHQANACERLTCTYCQQSRLNASLQSGARFMPLITRPKSVKNQQRVQAKRLLFGRKV